MSNTKKNRILQLDPVHFRELDGVVFDLESFARHCAPHSAPTALSPCAQAPITATQPVYEMQPSNPEPSKPQAVFAYEPVHIGWYPITIKSAPYPIMADANMVFGSSGSASSYLTSFLTSWQTSWGSYLSSGSFYSTFYGSFSGVQSGIGGYGLELI
ncbi:MAG: hypothetical protein Q4A63_06725 [Butyricicoccus pullicaecorum]|nr:hypothetical protein [Butyricicoccus pullicaecorum]MDO4669494.1 hypothetical protein [Butyricicoccus pullicaecorum]